MSSWQNISGLSRNEIVPLQNNKLHNFIRTQIYLFSPYYRRLFDRHKIRPDSIKTLNGLKMIPLIFQKDFFDTGNGGAVALGHPAGAEGTRTIITLLKELRHRNMHRGIASLCVGWDRVRRLL